MSAPGDPRIADDFVIAGDLAGDRLVNLGSAPVTVGGVEFYVPTPLAGVAELYTVSISERSADQLLPRLAEGLDYRGGSIGYQPNEALVLEARALCGTVATTAQVGLEAFANHHIARALDDTPARASDEDRLYRMSLVDRLARVLPEMLHRPVPTDESWWPVLRRLNGLAIEVRHPRPGPRGQKGLQDEKTLDQRLYGGEYRGAARMMASAFEHFSPGWLPTRKRDSLPEPPGGWPA